MIKTDEMNMVSFQFDHTHRLVFRDIMDLIQ